ncbi:vitamin K epoxide reductase family protein [Caldivirga sp. UBA161]|uniref:vitamin K epoxide reductase family protein n=1 Tax=Caldivirga sp. UBA161 TaxID=1915569 RepID=UPI0025BA0F17|nr:vitamin K epoxide reductase family protein [Caldivirga sp. UBA161]
MGRLTLKWLGLFIAFSVVGIFSSGVVLYTYYYLHNAPPLCTLNGEPTPFPGVTVNCIRVLSSPYAEVADVPLDVLAIFWFIINIIMAIAYDKSGEKVAHGLFRALMYWRFLGLAIIPYLLYVEFAILHALCLYCTIMHSMIIADFIVITVYAYLNRRVNAKSVTTVN